MQEESQPEEGRDRSDSMARRRVDTKAILKTLQEMYPDAKCALNHSSPFELLVATVLSAQCTDARVNIVTARIFRGTTAPSTSPGSRWRRSAR